LNARNVLPSEIHHQICQVYGDNAMSDGMVRKWVRMFNEGRESVQDEARNINQRNAPFLNQHFNLCLLHVSKSRVHLQGEGCTYRYGTGCFTRIRVGSLVRTSVCPVQTAYTDAYRTY